MTDILVIDDDRLMTQLIVSLLEDEGHTVRSAGSGEAGLADIARQRPDILVLDMKMPGLNGLDVARSLRAAVATSTLPIVALTGAETQAEADEAINAGCNAFVSKRDMPRLAQAIMDIEHTIRK